MRIDQGNLNSFEIEHDQHGVDLQRTDYVDNIYIEKSKAREVAIAICPELETEKINFAVGFAEWKDDGYLNDPVRGWYSKFFNGSHGRAHVTPTFYNNKELLDLYLTSKTNGNK